MIRNINTPWHCGRATHVADSSCPAERIKTSSNLAASSGPISARHAASASVRMFTLQLWSGGQAPWLKSFVTPYLVANVLIEKKR